MDATIMRSSEAPATRTGLTLFLVGLAGIASLLTTSLPLANLPKAVLEKFTPEQLTWLMLINPTLLLIIGVVVGSILYQRVHLTVFRKSDFMGERVARSLLLYGIVPGIVAGILILGTALVFKYIIPDELAKLNAEQGISLLARFLYGGITEEILLRFGLMTLFVWLAGKVVGALTPAVYWTGIVAAALLFGAGHLPALRLLIANPSTWLVLYILLGNSVAGIVFGWVYWRKGLVFAMIAHAAAHVILVLLG